MLTVEDLTIHLDDGRAVLDRVSLAVSAQKVTALVGGSGSGKTTLGLAVAGLYLSAMKRVQGRILCNGVDVTSLSPELLRQMRGRTIGMIFQEPLSAFNPLLRVGHQIQEGLEAHGLLSGKERKIRVLESLRSAGVDDPQRIAEAYPHELSGGLRQRAMIAQALVCRPGLLVADEPTSSLDVVTQARILDLLRHLSQTMGLSILFITHDLAVVRKVADEVVVLCAGRVVESGPTKKVIGSPEASYTKALLGAEL